MASTEKVLRNLQKADYEVADSWRLKVTALAAAEATPSFLGGSAGWCIPMSTTVAKVNEEDHWRGECQSP